MSAEPSNRRSTAPPPTFAGENLGRTKPRWGAPGENRPRKRTARRKSWKHPSPQARAGFRSVSAGQRPVGDVFKKISSWAAILFAPTLVGTIYGMNFDTMPELSWTFGYPFAIGLMGVVCVSLYFIFKRRDWL
ncbi:CorA family divalent cation transporter [Streptomyces sp. NPDC047071]|uniref:CorA family divalent cation transporter n=1 Tax=Streptomyces sp. NPDC047071 TaxID=3154808 RepID=UPI0034563B14